MSDNLGQHSGRITVLKLSSYLLFTEGSFTSVCTQLLRHVQLFEAPRTVAHQAPLSMGFSRQEHWSGLPFTSPGGLPSPGLNLRLLRLLHWQMASLPLVPPGKPFTREWVRANQRLCIRIHQSIYVSLRYYILFLEALGKKKKKKNELVKKFSDSPCWFAYTSGIKSSFLKVSLFAYTSGIKSSFLKVSL